MTDLYYEGCLADCILESIGRYRYYHMCANDAKKAYYRGKVSAYYNALSDYLSFMSDDCEASFSAEDIIWYDIEEKLESV